MREPQATVISQAGQRYLFAPGRGDQIALRPVRFAPLGLTVCSPRTETAQWGTPLGLDFSFKKIKKGGMGNKVGVTSYQVARDALPSPDVALVTGAARALHAHRNLLQVDEDGLPMWAGQSVGLRLCLRLGHPRWRSTSSCANSARPPDRRSTVWNEVRL